MAYNPESSSDRKALATLIVDMLITAKFEKVDVEPGRERIYRLAVKRPGLFVTVYTTIVGDEVRHVGKDAIRVCLVYRPKRQQLKSRGVSKFTRVNRVGELSAIVERTLGRMRDAYRGASDVTCCRHCGSPQFMSKADKPTCAALCWIPDSDL